MSPTELSQIEGRVFNWARWATSSESRHRCASAEGKYLPPAPDDAKLEFLRSNPLDILDAENIERSVCLLPSSGRILIVMFYVKQIPVQRISKQLRLGLDTFHAFRLRNLKEIAEHADRLRSVHLIKRGKPIWAGLAK